MAVIAVFNQKGGVGKTTTCLNITAALHLARQSPVALDMDPQSHLTLASGAGRIAPNSGMASFFKEQAPLSRLLHKTPRGWQLIPSTLELAKIDALFGRDPKAATLLRRGMQDDPAFGGGPVLIDCCPMLGVLTLNALLATDRVLIPMSADFLSLQGVHRLDSALNVLEQRLNRRFERRIVVTRFDPKRKLAFEVDDKLRERYGELVCATRIGENAALAASPMHGQDVFEFASFSPGAADYRKLTEELWESGFFA